MTKLTPTYARYNSAEFDLLNSLAELIFHYALDLKQEAAKKLHMLLLHIMKSFYQHITPLKQHYEKIFGCLSQFLFNCEKSNKEELIQKSYAIISGCKMLKMMLESGEKRAITGIDRKPDIALERPCVMFYFLPNQCGLSVDLSSIRPQQWHFDKGYAVVMWIKYCPGVLIKEKASINNSSGAIGSSSLHENPILFRIRSNTKGFECFLNDNEMMYRTIPEAYSKPNSESNGLKIGKLETNKWICLAIVHDNTAVARVNVLMNAEETHYVTDYPKFHEGVVQEITFCEAFPGYVSSVMMFEAPISGVAIRNLFNKTPHGLDCVDSVLSISSITQEKLYFGNN